MNLCSALCVSLLLYAQLCAQLASAVEVISDFVNVYEIRDPRDPTKFIRARSKTATFVCSEKDADSEHEFQIVTATDSVDAKGKPIPPSIEYFRVKCVEPTWTFAVRELGQSPLYVIDSSYSTRMTPYNQNESLPAETEFNFKAPLEHMGQQAGYGRRLLSIPSRQKRRGWDPKFKPSLQVGTGGIGIGVDLGCLLDVSWFGGCGSGDLSDVMGKLEHQLDLFTNFSQQTLEWQVGAETRFNKFTDAIDILKQQNANTDAAVAKLNQEIPLLWEFEMMLAEQVTEGFTQFKAALAQEAGKTDQLSRLFMGMFNSTNQQFLDTNRALQGQSRNIQNLISTIWDIYRDTGMRRAATQLYWDMTFSPMVVPEVYEEYQPLCADPQLGGQDPEYYCDPDINLSERFVGSGIQPAGNPPMEAAKRSVRNEAVSITMAESVVQWTEIVGSVKTAKSAFLELKCDRLFLLNNVVPGMSLKVLFARLGPTDCFDKDHINRWTCACVVRVTSYSCPMKDKRPDKSFPFSYIAPSVDNQGRSYGPMKPTLVDSESEVCENNVARPDPRNPLIIDSHEMLVDEMIGMFCTQDDNRMYASQKGWTFLVGALEMQAKWNVTTPRKVKVGAKEKYTKAGCTNTFYETAEAGPSGSVASNLYFSWIQTYSLLSKSVLIDEENLVYGSLPYGVQTNNIPYDRENKTFGNVRTLITRFSSVATNMVPLNYLSLESTFAGVEGRIVNREGGVLPAVSDTVRFQPGVQEQYPWLQVPNRTLTSNVLMTVRGQEAMAPFLFRYGGIDENFVYDTAPDLIGTGVTAGALCHKLNYLLHGTNWTGPFTREQWDAHNHVQYDPSCATESLLYYRRYLTKRGLDVTKRACEYSFSTGAGAGGFPEYTWCSILKDFMCSEYEAAKGARFMKCIPKKYTVQATLTIPAGTLQSIVTSDCPDVKITRVGGFAVATLTSAADYPNLVSVVTRAKSGSAPGCGKPGVEVRRDVQLYPRVSTDFAFNDCPDGEVMMNIATRINPNDFCFSNWIDVSQTKDYVGPFINPKPIVEQVTRDIRDNIADALARQLAAQVDFQNEIARIAERGGNDRAKIARDIEQAVRNRTIDINKDLKIPNITDRAKEIDKIIKDQTAKIMEDIEKNKASRVELEKLMKEIRELNAEGAAQIARLNDTVRKIIEANKETQKAIDEWRKSKASTEGCGFGIPILGDIFCFVKNLFSGGTNLLGKILGSIFLILVLACVCYILVMCCMQCAQCRLPDYRQQQQAQLSGQVYISDAQMQYIQAWLQQHQGATPVVTEAMRENMKKAEELAAKSKPAAAAVAEVRPLLSGAAPASRRLYHIARIRDEEDDD